MKVLIATILFFNSLATMAIDKTAVLEHLIREPKIKTAHPPIIILLHGVGSNESDLFSFAHQLPDTYRVISARAPIKLADNSFAWYEVDFSTGKPIFNIQQEEESRAILIKFISQLKEKYSAHSNEIYLCGFSQGGIMSYSVALTRPDLVKGIAVMSGRLLEEIKPKIAASTDLLHLKVLISHGKYDNRLPHQYAKEAVAYLKTLKIHPTFHEYKAGHEINGEMLLDLINWLR